MGRKVNMEEYTEEVRRHIHDVSWLARECVERMKINVGLIAENDALKRRVQHLEEGRADWVDPLLSGD